VLPHPLPYPFTPVPPLLPESKGVLPARILPCPKGGVSNTPLDSGSNTPYPSKLPYPKGEG